VLRGGAEDFAWEGVCGLGLVDGELAVDDDVVDALGGGEEFDGGVLNIFWSNRTRSAAMPGLVLPQSRSFSWSGRGRSFRGPLQGIKPITQHCLYRS
jgi:hypothetical protein